jgi:hypothetical protein
MRKLMFEFIWLGDHPFYLEKLHFDYGFDKFSLLVIDLIMRRKVKKMIYRYEVYFKFSNKWD